MISPVETKNEFFDYYQRKGFVREVGIGPQINADYWKLLLVNSVLVRFTPVFEGQEAISAPLCSQQVGFSDIPEKVEGSDGYLTSFEQIGTGSQHHSDEGAATIFWEFFEYRLSMDRSRFSVTIPEGDEKAYDIWSKLGFTDFQIRPRKGNILNVDDNKVGGNYSAIVYDRGSQYHQNQKVECNLDCSCGRFSELGDIGFLQGRKGSKLIDSGVGLERLVAVLNENSSVFQAGSLKEIQDLVLTDGQIVNCDQNTLKVVTDHLRTIVTLINGDVLPSNKGAGYIVRKLIRNMCLSVIDLGISSPRLSLQADKVAQILVDNQYISSINRGDITQIIKSEEEKFMNLIKNGKLTFDKFIRGKISISTADLHNLYTTYGLPEEITRKLAIENGISITS